MRRAAADLVALMGVGVLVVGLWEVSPALGLIALGLALVATAVVIAKAEAAHTRRTP